MNGTLFCNKCGAPNASTAQFCNRCGGTLNPVPGGPPTPAPYPAVAPPAAPGYAPAAQVSAVMYGGFWIRVVATIVDAIIVRIVVAPVGMIFGGLSWLGGMNRSFPHAGFAILGGGITAILVIAGQWLYEAFLESSSYQATVGKMIFGMKVTDLQGNRISFARATGRHFAKWISAMILFFGFIMVGFMDRKQGLHDVLAGTLVRR